MIHRLRPRRTGPDGAPVPRRSFLRAGLLLTSGVAGFMAITLAHRVADVTRGTPVASLRANADGSALPVDAPRFPEIMMLLTGVPLRDGHTLDITISGDVAFPGLWADLRAARRSITFQSYYCGAGEVADSAVGVLGERARAGVRVLFIADGFGCRRFANRYGDELRDAGVSLTVLRPIRWHTLHRAQHRSHVRTVVIDAAIAWTGGFGLDDKWLSADGTGWRDTNVRFTGPAVLQTQAAFIAAWGEATGELVADDALLQPPPDLLAVAPRPLTGPRFAASPEHRVVTAGVQFAGPGLGNTPFERLVILSVAAARERLYITNSYFIPGAHVRSLMAAAARRGVDVRVLTAGPRTDIPSTRLVGRSGYDPLLAAGVRIFEYLPTMMHAKTFVVDGTWVSVGGMNLDNRSLRLNDELNLLVHDTAVGRHMEEIFHADLAASTEITLEAHRARPWPQRLLERTVRWMAPLL